MIIHMSSKEPKPCNTGTMARDTDLDHLSLSHKREAASVVSCMSMAIMHEQKHEPSEWNGDMYVYSPL